MKRLHWVVAGAAVLGLGLASCGEAPDLSTPSSDGPALAGRMGGAPLETIDFEGFAAGQIVSTVFGDLGSGPILVRGKNPFLNPNAAMIIDSSNPPPWDLDLGTPNQACGGPGVGGNVGPGTPFENCTPLGNVVVIAANLIDQDGDGLVDNPDDFNQTAYPGVLATLDFSALGGVTLQSITVIDFDGNGPNPRVELMGAGGLIATFPIPNTMPSNGVTTVSLGPTPGVLSMVVYLQGSGGFDNIVFGEQPPPLGEIGDTVWCDLNNDGTQDPGEPGLEGVVVNLTCTLPDGSTLNASTTTDANGHYLFTDVPAGDCHVEVDVNTAPQGCDQIGQCPTEMDIVLGPGESFLDADFCFRPPTPELGEIGDFVWCDLNNDGIQDPGEPGLEGVVVYLTCTLPDGTTLTSQTTTDATGYYLFTGIPAGTCQVAVDAGTAPAGCDEIGQCPLSMTVVLGPGESFLDADFCFYPPPLEPQDCCENGIKPTRLTLQYTGEDCSASNTLQPPDKWSCSGDPAFAPLVHIRATEKGNPSDTGGKIWFEGDVPLNGQFDLLASNAGTDHFASNTYVHIFTPGGALLQTVKFHTSCSQPLVTGDQWGSVILLDCGNDVPSGGESCCEGGNKPTRLTLEYTGEDCSASNTLQPPDKWSCSGDPMFAPLVHIRASDKSNPNDNHAKVWFEGNVPLNGQFDLLTSNAGQDKFAANTFVHVFDLAGTLLQTVSFHTSCSQPLVKDDQWGSLILIDCGNDQPGGSNDSCDDGNPQVLAMRYTGEDCSASHTAQPADKWSCTGDPMFAPLVHIKATDKSNPDDSKAKIWFEGDVTLNGLFDIDAMNAGQSKLKANTWVHITAPDGTPLQRVSFHTSCSQVIVLGDQWGSLILEGYTPEP